MNASSTVADFRRVVGLLAELDDAAATRTAAAIARWLAGEEFESAAGLKPGWRQHVQQKAIAAVLVALVTPHLELDDSTIARRIVAGVKRMVKFSGIRPDGEAGLYVDLARAGFDYTERTCRRHISAIRGRCNCGVGQDSAASFRKEET